MSLFAAPRHDTLRRVLLLLAAAALCGALANQVRPRPLSWMGDWSRHMETRALRAGVPVVSLATVREMVDTGRDMLLDARPSADFENGHIPGALSLPLREFDAAYPAVSALLSRDERLVVYCSGRACDEALVLAERLRRMGHASVALFVDGLTSWEQAGLPVERRP